MQDRIKEPSVVSHVAAIWNPNQPHSELKERDRRVHTHDGHSQKIQYYYGCYDLVEYPLLFPLGEHRWHQGIKKNKANNIARASPGQRLVLANNAAIVENLIAQEAAGKSSILIGLIARTPP